MNQEKKYLEAFKLALEVLEAEKAEQPDKDDDRWQKGARGAEAIKKCQEAISILEGKTFATDEQIKAAKDLYQDDECEIDEGALTSEADTGVWVAAWVWLSDLTCPRKKDDGQDQI